MLTDFSRYLVLHHFHDTVVEVFPENSVAYLAFIIPLSSRLVKRKLHRRQRFSIAQGDPCALVFDVENLLAVRIANRADEIPERPRHGNALCARKPALRCMKMVVESPHDITNPRDNALYKPRVTFPNVPQEWNTAFHIRQSVRNHLLNHIRIAHIGCADLLAVCVELFLGESLRAADRLHEVVVDVGIVRLHPVHRLVPERPLRRDLTVHVEECHPVLMKSMQGRIALEEHHRHSHLIPPVGDGTLTRTETVRRDELDVVQHFPEGFLTTGREKFFLLAFLLS